jgi:hypothetical protein
MGRIFATTLALVTLFHVLVVVVERINSLADLAPHRGYFASDLGLMC